MFEVQFEYKKNLKSMKKYNYNTLLLYFIYFYFLCNKSIFYISLYRGFYMVSKQE